MKPKWICGLLLLWGLFPQSLLAQGHTERGAVLGGVAGALAGAGIGEHNGDTAAGALIGGAVGLITGGAIGNSMDQDAARAQALEQQRLYRLSRAVSSSDVVTMAHNSVSDDVIINHIRQNGVQRRLEVTEVISLHKQGVSAAVITAMQQAPLATSLPAPSVRRRPAVIVEQHRYVPPSPAFYWPYHVHHRHPYHSPRPHRPGFHWSIAVGR